jgi:RNA polymerase sigma-70 factor (ECF subfamily)
MHQGEGVYRDFSDADLVKLVGSGDHTAFAELYERYWGVLFVHCMKMLRDEDEAKDVLQELFTSLWTKSAELQFSTSVSAYLYSAVRNKVFNLMAHQKVKRNYSAGISKFMQQGEFITDEQVRLNELKRIIEREVALLPPKMREVFEMSRNQQLSHKEIAGKLGISDKTVRKQINNALKILKVKLNVSAGLLVVLLLR